MNHLGKILKKKCQYLNRPPLQKIGYLFLADGSKPPGNLLLRPILPRRAIVLAIKWNTLINDIGNTQLQIEGHELS